MAERVHRSGSHSFSDVAKQEKNRGGNNLRISVGIAKAAELNINMIDETIVSVSVHNLELLYFLSRLCKKIARQRRQKSLA